MSKGSAAGGGAPVAWRRRKDQRPAEILAAARQLLEEDGVEGASMARIAKAAGVSEATVYKYFENKQELLNNVLRDWAMPYIETMAAEFAHVTGVQSRLRLIAMRYLRSMGETPKLHRVYYQELRWSDYQGSLLHKLNQRFAKTVTTAVEDGIRDGELRPDVDPSHVRDMLFGGLEHIAMRTSFVGRPIDIENEAARFVDLILRGAEVRPAAPVPAPAGPDPLARLEALVTRLERVLPDDDNEPSMPS